MDNHGRNWLTGMRRQIAAEHQVRDEIQASFRFATATVFLLRAIGQHLGWTQRDLVERAALKTLADFLAGLSPEDQERILSIAEQMRQDDGADMCPGTDLDF